MSDCTFKGNLVKGSHFIDGKSISDDSPKMAVKNCKFLGNESEMLISDSNALFMGEREKVIDSIKRKNLNQSKEIAVIVITVTASVAFFAIFGFVINIKRENNNILNEDERPSSDDNDI